MLCWFAQLGLWMVNSICNYAGHPAQKGAEKLGKSFPPDSRRKYQFSTMVTYKEE
jgi:hypothetical protein